MVLLPFVPLERGGDPETRRAHLLAHQRATLAAVRLAEADAPRLRCAARLEQGAHYTLPRCSCSEYPYPQSPHTPASPSRYEIAMNASNTRQTTRTTFCIGGGRTLHTSVMS